MVKVNGHLIRRFVFWVTSLGGVILISLLLLYYSGYRFSWEQARIIRVGSLGVYVQPQGSQVFLNGEPLGYGTPGVYNSIAPGEYSVSIQQQGFQSIEFPITIQSKQTTVIDKIFLPIQGEKTVTAAPPPLSNITSEQLKVAQGIQEWPIWKISGDHPTAVITGPNRRLSVSTELGYTEIDTQVGQMDTQSNLHQLVYTKEGTAWILFTDQDSSIKEPLVLTRQTQPFVDIALVPDTQSVILADQHRVQLAQLGPQQTISLTTLVAGTHIEQVWVNSKGTVLLYQDEGTWYQLALQE